MRASTECAVIAFPQERVKPSVASPDHPRCEVVIFTGIRVERLYDLAERLPAARSRSSRKRRHGEIEYY